LDKFAGNLYAVELPRMYNELRQLGQENGEIGKGTGYYNNLLSDLQGHLETLGAYMGIIEAPASVPNAPSNMPEMPQEAILNDSAIIPMDETSAVAR
jgi:hypothetical protein